MKKKTYKYITRLCLLLCCITTATVAKAQIDINVRVLPPYSSHITDFASHPQQIMLMVHNSGASAANVQLRGSITADNGIAIAVSKNYRSGSPLHLSAGEVRNLTGNDINALFDYSQLTFSGITKDQLISQGNLPEGNYQICVRAFDYNTNAPLSDDECSNIFPISNVEAPTILKPMDADNIPSLAGQNFIITWSMPAGSPPSTQYIVKIVEILDNRSPENAIMSATQPSFFQTTVTGTSVLLYNQAMPALTVGRHYALVVQAKDPTNTVTFRNNGVSEVVGFIYGEEAQPPVIDNGQDNNVVCSCKTAMPANTQPSTNAIGVGGIIKAAGFDVTVLTLIKNNDKTITGTGKVNLPVVNSSVVPVSVEFNGIQINSSNELISGSINAKVKSDINFLPAIASPNASLIPFTAQNVDDLSSYIDKNTTNAVSNIKNAAASAAFQLPVGIDKQVGGSPVTIEITALHITPTQATMDAATVINTPDGGAVSRIALGAKNVCVNATDLCGEAKLFLAEDLFLPAINLTLKGAANPKGGSYVLFNKDGFSKLQIVADITLPQSLVMKKSDNGPVTAEITATTDKGWSDWMAQVTIDPFVMASNKDFGFALAGAATYDHSDVQNPANMPNIAEKPELQATQWHGFFMPQLNVNLPAVLKNAAGAPIQVAVQNLVLDNNGVTAKLNALNILKVDDGNLGGWYYSIDNIGLSIINNDFQNGGMNGKLVLPVSDKGHQNAQLDYHCTLSNGDNGSGMQFEFGIQPKDNLDFALWVATAQIDQSSNIKVTVGAGQDLSAVATLSGHISIDANLPVVGKVNFAQMQFQKLTLNTSGPEYLSLGSTIFSVASPQHSLGGNATPQAGYEAAPPANNDMGDFPVTIDHITPYVNGGKVGMTFTIDVKLGDIAALPSASTTLSVYGKLKMNGSRPQFYFDLNDAVQLDAITIDGDVGPVAVHGSINFYSNDATFGNGFKGHVDATFPPLGTSISSTIQFGSTNYKAAYNYKYWYIDALLDLGQAGLPLGNSGLSFFGFGGGAYYHMTKPDVLPSAASFNGSSTKNPTDNAPVGASLSGIVYKPDPQIAIGLKATLIFGTVARPTFNADVTLGVEVTESGGLAKVSFEGNARVLQLPGSAPDQAVVTGKISAEYNFVEKSFEMHVGAAMSYPPFGPIHYMTANANCDFYFGQGKWFIKLGTPQDKMNLTYLDIFKYMEGYLEVGNAQLDKMPPIPQEVADVLRKSGVTVVPNLDPALSTGGGFMFGADTKFDYSGSFAIFRASFGATVGFDFALKDVSDANITCENGQTSVGVGGWYATGQVYAGVWGSIDISTDWFGDINVLDVGAGAALAGGLPNPTFASGAIGGYYSVLDGAISGSLHYEFSVGTKCTVTQDALSGFSLVSELTPSDKSVNLEITTEPEVAFNFKLGSRFSILQSTGAAAKDTVRRYFLFDESCVTETWLDESTGKAVAFTPMTSQDKTGITYVINNMIEPSHNYTVSVSASLKEFPNGGGAPVTALYKTKTEKHNIGDPFTDTRTVHFGTNKGVKKIDDSFVEYTYPLKWQRFFLPKEATTTVDGNTANAAIKTSFAYNASSFDMPGVNREFYAKLVPLPSGPVDSFPIKMGADLISFNMPSDLKPNTVYALRILARSWNTAPASARPFAVKDLVATRAFSNVNTLSYYRQVAGNGSYSNDTIRTNSLNNPFALANNEMELYVIYFKTSTYQLFDDKKTDMPITNIEFKVSGVPTTDSYTMSLSTLDGLKNSKKSLKAFVAKNLGVIKTDGDTLATNTTYTNNFSVDYMRSVYFDGKEYFDDYDIKGFDASSTQVGHTYSYHITPLISITNKRTTGWINSVSDVLLNEYGLQAAYNQGILYNNPLIGSRIFSDTISDLDAREVGNIDINVVNGGETTQFMFGSLNHFASGRPGQVYALPISYALKATYTEGWKTTSGTGANPANDANRIIGLFRAIYGGDPPNRGLQNLGNAYQVGINTYQVNSSITGGSVGVSYNLPGVFKGASSVTAVSFGNLSAGARVGALNGAAR